MDEIGELIQQFKANKRMLLSIEHKPASLWDPDGWTVRYSIDFKGVTSVSRPDLTGALRALLEATAQERQHQ